MSPVWIRRYALALLLIAAFVLRAWHPERMSVEHFDEGVYASNLFSDHIGFRYPDQQLYAPPLLPAVLEWVLIFSGANPHAVMWVNVVLGTVLVWAVWWTTREFAGGGVPSDLRQESRADPNARRAGRVRPPMDYTQDADPFLADAAALSAAAVVAFSDVLIQYSRAALTDIPVCLWITLAVGTGLRGLRTGGWPWLGASAALTALAWWTKYNGWLPLAILGAGAAGWIGFRFLPFSGSPNGTRAAPERLPDFLRSSSLLLRFGIIAAGAMLLWLPCLWQLQQYGGYAAVAENHRGYIVGWTGWWSGLLRHLAVDRYDSRSLSAAGIFLSITLAGQVFTWNGRTLPRVARVAIGYASYIAALCLLPGCLMLGMVPCLIAGLVLFLAMEVLRLKSEKKDQPCPLAFWILAAWLIGLGLTTPLYRPYPRLILPWLTGAIIASGLGWASIFQYFGLKLAKRADGPLPAAKASTGREDIDLAGLQYLRRHAVVLLAGVVAFAAVGIRTDRWQDRRGLKRAADEIVSTIQQHLPGRPKSALPNLDCVIYVLAEPGLYYHLAAQEDQALRFITQPAANLGLLEPGKTDPRVPTYLITGPHSRQEAAELSDREKGVRSVAVFSYFPSDLVLLDEVPPAALAASRRQSLQLWTILQD